MSAFDKLHYENSMRRSIEEVHVFKDGWMVNGADQVVLIAELLDDILLHAKTLAVSDDSLEPIELYGDDSLVEGIGTKSVAALEDISKVASAEQV